jgi:hypothetical protein
MFKHWLSRVRPSPAPRVGGECAWVSRRVVAGLSGVLVVLLAWNVILEVTGGRPAEPVSARPSAHDSRTPRTVLPSSSVQAASSSAGGVAVASGSAPPPIFAGFTDPGSVYAFMIPSALRLDWAPYIAANQATASLVAQFQDVYAAFVEAWSFSDPQDPRYQLWCVATCRTALNAVLAPWAAARLSPTGTLRLSVLLAEIGRNGTTGVVEVCVDDSALSARNEGDQRVVAPSRFGPTLWVFGLVDEGTGGHWVAMTAISAVGSTQCAGAGTS